MKSDFRGVMFHGRMVRSVCMYYVCSPCPRRAGRRIDSSRAVRHEDRDRIYSVIRRLAWRTTIGQEPCGCDADPRALHAVLAPYMTVRRARLDSQQAGAHEADQAGPTPDGALPKLSRACPMPFLRHVPSCVLQLILLLTPDISDSS